MFFSYLKLAFRNLFRYKLYSFINIIGLSVAIGVCITAYVNYQFSQSFDTFHENVDKIYSVNSYKELRGNKQNWAIIPMPMAKAIQKDIPGIEKMSRLSVSNGMIRFQDKVFNETFHYTDPEFFDMFSYPLKFGDKDDLKNKSGLVLSEEVAHKYFGEKNPIGKQLIVSLDGEKEFQFFVKAVTKTSPKNTSMPLSVMIPMERLKELRGLDPEDWEAWSRATFIQVADNISTIEIERQMQSYTETANNTNPDWQIEGFYLDPLPELAFNLHEIRGSILRPGMHPAAIISPSLTALFVLLLACFNFVNTAIASASRRLKEIGIRKVVGGIRWQLIKQFMGENLLLCFIALLLGMVLAEIFVPFYDSLWPDWSISMTYVENIVLIIFLSVLLVFTAIASGAYPAFYVSAFSPVKILKGRQQIGGTNKLINVLLTFQFALSMAAIICGIIFSQNAEYIKTLDMGYDREQIIVVPVRGEKNLTILKNEIQTHPDVSSIGASRNLVGASWSTVEIKSEEKISEVTRFILGENYFETQGLRLIEGRKLDHNLQTDIDEAVLVNETFVNEFGWESALGRLIKIKGSEEEKEFQVVGVVRDFNYNGVWGKIRPAILRMGSPDSYRYLSIKSSSDNLKAMSAYVENQWKILFPSLPYDGFFLEQMEAEALMVTESISTVFLYISFISVLIAAMGLFALVSLNAARRTKEFGIRKILGATTITIGRLLSMEFFILLVVSSVLAAIMGYFMVDSMITSIFAYSVSFGPIPFLLATFFIFVVAAMTVSSQVFKIVTTNPVDSIRDE